MTFEDLIDDILLHVLSFVTINDKVRFKRINSKWQRLVSYSLRREKTISTRLCEPHHHHQTWACSSFDHQSNGLNVISSKARLSDIVKLVDNFCPNVVALKLDRLVIESKELNQLASTECWRKWLVHLELSYCDLRFNEREWTEALDRKREMPFEHLNVFNTDNYESDKWRIKDKYVYRLLERCPGVRELSLGDTRLDGRVSQCLGHGLEKLALNGKALIGGLECLKPSQGFTVKQFSIRGRMSLLPDIKNVAALMPNLVLLQIPIPRPELFPVTVPFPVHYNSVAIIIASMIRLQRIDFETDEGYFEHENIDPILIKLALERGPQLKSIRVGLYPVTDASLLVIGSYCTRLEELSLGVESEPSVKGKVFKCLPVTNQSLRAVIGLTNLRTICFNRTNIDTSGVKLLLDNLPLLTEATFNYSPNVGNQIVNNVIGWVSRRPNINHTLKLKNSDCVLSYSQERLLATIHNLIFDCNPFLETCNSDDDFLSDSSDSNDIFF